MDEASDMQEVHETYGRRLRSKAEKTSLCPGEDGGGGGVRLYTDQSGVTRVGYIFVNVLNSRYANTVEKDTIHYGHTTFPRAHSLMHTAYVTGQRLPVEIGDGKAFGFFWGHAKIQSYGGDTKQYVLRRCEDEPQAEVVEPEEVAPAVPAAVPVPAAAPPPVAIGREVVTSEGLQFDSVLEYRHSILASALGIPFRREDVPCFTVELDDNKYSYTPDLLFYSKHHTDTTIVEIKCRYPYDDELRRCRAVAETLRGVRVVLLYGNSMTPPFASGKRPRDSSGYEHADGIRGISFQWNFDTDCVTTLHDVAYGYDEERGCGILEARSVPGDRRFSNERVQRAYHEARSAPVP